MKSTADSSPLPAHARSFKFAALCAALSAVTTFLLWLLPRLYTPAANFDAAIALRSNPLYLGRLWVNFLHVFLAWTAYAAAASLLRRRSGALAGGGLAAFSLWGATELLGVTTIIFAVNGTWRSAFATASPEIQQQLRLQITGFQAVWDAMFFLLLVAFLLGTLCFGLAALRGDRLERALGWLFLLAAPLTIAIMLGNYTRFTALDPVADWSYPFLQPISRALLSVWLWRGARNLPS